MLYGSDNMTITHVDMEHNGINTGLPHDCFLASTTNDGGSDNVTLSYCYMHNVNRTMMHVSHVTNMLIEHNFFEYRHDDTGIHGEGISMNKCGLK